MSKELAGELFCRVDIDYRLYKKLKEEHEMTLLKIYDKEHRKLYKDNKEWCEINETFKELIKDSEESKRLLDFINSVTNSIDNKTIDELLNEWKVQNLNFFKKLFDK